MQAVARTTAVVSALAVALTIVLAAPAARAEPTMNLKVDWSRVASSAAKNLGLIRGGVESSTTTRYYGPLSDQGALMNAQMNGVVPVSTAADGLAVKPELSGTGRSSTLSLTESYTSIPWFGVAPRVSLVARDWGGAKSLVGGDIALTDALRTSHSYRLALTRIRFGSGRFVPFAQLGLGEYRIDTDVIPNHMADTELAALVGGGFEVHMVRERRFGLDFAAETNFTQIVRDAREPGNVPTSRMCSSLLAMRMRF
jgi:hypothetical protein